MAITGKFVADFSEFEAGVQKADTALRTLEGSGTKLSTTFSGNMATIGKATSTTTNVFGTMRESLSQVDRTLAQFGVNLTPQVAVLGELSQVAGKSATQLGAMGTAGAIAAAALGGWNVGRWIADLTGADKAIANFTSRLLGMGDLAGETTAAKMDMLARASKTAGRDITDLSEAVTINEAAAKQHAAQFVSSAGRIKEWNEEIGELGATGQLKALRADLEGNAMSLQELSDKYGISKGAIDHWKDSLEASKASTKAAHEAILAHNKAIAETERAYAKLTSSVMNELGEAQMKAEKAAMDQAQASADANAEGLRLMEIDFIKFEEDTAAAAEKARQTEYDAWFKSVNEGVLIVGQAIDATDAKVTASLARTQAAVTSWSQAMMLVNQGLGTLGGTVQSGGPFTATREQIEASAAAGRYFGPVDELGRPDFSRLSPRGGSGTVNTININASNSFYDDPSSVQRLADKVGTAVMSGLRSRGAKA